MQTSTVAGMFPFISDALQDEEGFYVGYNKYPVMIDFFKRNHERVNSNMVVIGKSGSGKSFAAKLLLTNFAASDAKIFILDPEREYVKLTTELGGKEIDVGSGLKYRFNPLHIMATLEDEDGEASDSYTMHLQFLEEFFKIILEGISPDALETLNKIVADLYGIKNINSKTDIMKLKPEDFPTFDELYELIQKKHDASTDEYLRVNYKFVDIAGLVKGASEGAGLGNKFLSHIRECDAIVQVVRVFENPDIIKTGTNPVEDAQIINLELVLADLESVVKMLEKAQKAIRVGAGGPEAQIEYDALSKIKKVLEQGKMASEAQLSKDEHAISKRFCLITSKPMIYVANIDEMDFDKRLEEINGLVPLIEYAKTQKANVITMSASLEDQLNNLDDGARAEFMAELGIKERTLDKLIKEGFSLLGLTNFLTAGEKEVRAWTIPVGTTAAKAAGVIHTDFEKNFVKAEVVKYGDLVALGSSLKVKEAGKLRLSAEITLCRRRCYCI
ncbi:obg gtpase family [Holotrichia oblita]|nr:obg gtpase family [Holotrichia oblita]